MRSLKCYHTNLSNVRVLLLPQPTETTLDSGHFGTQIYGRHYSWLYPGVDAEYPSIFEWILVHIQALKHQAWGSIGWLYYETPRCQESSLGKGPNPPVVPPESTSRINKHPWDAQHEQDNLRYPVELGLGGEICG